MSAPKIIGWAWFEWIDADGIRRASLPKFTPGAADTAQQNAWVAVEAVAVEACQCPAVDLLSTGHLAGCPEAKK